MRLRRRREPLRALTLHTLIAALVFTLAGCKANMPRSAEEPLDAPGGGVDAVAHPTPPMRVKECIDTGPLQAQIDALNQSLAEKDRQQQDTDQKLDALRIQLDAERGERQHLEHQLRALKSLEEHIKERDAGNSP